MPLDLTRLIDAMDPSPKPVAVDLFCGAGGATLGLEMAGFDVTGYDFWDRAVECHELNGMKAVQRDLLEDPLTAADVGPVDLLWASPPCQPFSQAGSNKGKSDARDGFPATIKSIASIRPPVFVTENVKNLAGKNHRDYLDSVLDSMRAIGYEVEWRVLNCADYGVPQRRQRLIIVGRCDGAPIHWPEPIHAEKPTEDLLPWITVAEALGWNTDAHYGFPRKNQEADEGQPREAAQKFDPATEAAPTVDTTGRWRLYDGPDSYVSVPAEEMAALQGFPPNTGAKVNFAKNPNLRASPYAGHLVNGGGRPLEPDAPAPTVCASTSGNRCPWVDQAGVVPAYHQHLADGGASSEGEVPGARRLTQRELALLQRFPDGFRFPGTKTNQFTLIGNAFPAAVADAIGRALR